MTSRVGLDIVCKRSEEVSFHVEDAIPGHLQLVIVMHDMVGVWHDQWEEDLFAS